MVDLRRSSGSRRDYRVVKPRPQENQVTVGRHTAWEGGTIAERAGVEVVMARVFLHPSLQV